MAWVALNCPQCSAPLPRVAIWRSVKCASCGALIRREESIVTRDSFRRALARSRQQYPGGDLVCAGEHYQILQSLGSGDISEVYLARRLGQHPFLATIKLSSSPQAAARFEKEAHVLRELHGTGDDSIAAYSAQRLPAVFGFGAVEGGSGQSALILQHPNGYWGSLAALSARFPNGIDPRHAVWIWRRMLDTLYFVHARGWSHGDVRPEHALVNSQDHGVRLISWAEAKQGAGEKAQADDLMRSARVVQVMLCGTHLADKLPSQVPQGLAELVLTSAHDATFCRKHGARGLDSTLLQVAKDAFGPPAFLPLDL